MDLPYGWTESFAIKELLRITDDLMKRVGTLEQRVIQLEQGKQDRRGRKPIATK